MWNSDEGRTISYWQASEDSPATNQLTQNIETEICVVGAGIAGLTSAYLLSRQGRRVAVIDDGPIGGGETARTTAHLTYALDDRIYRIEKWHGEEKARLAVESHAAAINKIEQIVDTENIDCDFSRLDGFLVEAEKSDDDLDEEIASAHRLGFRDIELSELPIDKFPNARAIRFPNQGQFHVLKYLDGLIRGITGAGGQIFSNTRAAEWKGEKHPVVTVANGQKISAQKVILATNYPIQTKMFPKLAPYRTYAIAAHVPKGSVPRMLLWDTADPYHYVRLQEDDGHDMLIVGGEDHRTGQENDGIVRFERLWSWTRRYFPSAEQIVHRWSGQVFETHDGLAYIGRVSDDEPNVFMITGDSGMGMTHCTLGAMIVSDLIVENKNPWVSVYDPSRLATTSLREAVPELINSTVPYADWVTPGEISSVDELSAGQGAVIRDGMSKLAAFRDASGQLHVRSAVCTHMGCIVRFNSAEATWDCPCHGSRFATDGTVINAPAIAPLENVSQEPASKTARTKG